MIAVIDQSSRHIYFISDVVKRFEFDEAVRMLQMFRNEYVSVVPVKSILASDLINILSAENRVASVSSDDNSHQANTNSSNKKNNYIVPTRASAVIVSGLNPPLMFENGYDYKDVSTLRNTYGGELPHQIEKLLSNGRLKYVSSVETEELERKKKENIKIAQRKHKNGGRKVDSSDGMDDSDDESEDRLVRKATRINL